MLCLPFLISALIGWLFLRIVCRGETPPGGGIQFFLAAGLGLGISGLITFAVILTGNGLNRESTFIIHGILILILGALAWRSLDKTSRAWNNPQWTGIVTNGVLLLALMLLCVPALKIATAFPHGGWDAWAVWNFKAKCLYLGGENWRAMFDPLAWRSSPHYPFLLPLINVWGWLFTDQPLNMIPLMNSLIFIFLTAGLLLFVLKKTLHPWAALLVPAILLTNSFYLKLATSQYADVVLGYYYLAGMFSLFQTFNKKSAGYGLLGGIYFGLAGFTKSEGLSAILIVTLIASVILLRRHGKGRDNPLWGFLGGLFVFSIPTMILHVFLSPGNQTFINGLTSSTHPSNLYRLQAIFLGFALGIFNKQWLGLWILLAAGLVIGKRTAPRGTYWAIPLFIFLYLLSVAAYYFINTEFEIIWFLSNTFHRIILALIPCVLMWAGLGLKLKTKRPHHFN